MSNTITRWLIRKCLPGFPTKAAISNGGARFRLYPALSIIPTPLGMLKGTCSRKQIRTLKQKHRWINTTVSVVPNHQLRKTIHLDLLIASVKYLGR